jgi:hypothetical protein
MLQPPRPGGQEVNEDPNRRPAASAGRPLRGRAPAGQNDPRSNWLAGRHVGHSNHTLVGWGIDSEMHTEMRERCCRHAHTTSSVPAAGAITVHRFGVRRALADLSPELNRRCSPPGNKYEPLRAGFPRAIGRQRAPQGHASGRFVRPVIGWKGPCQGRTRGPLRSRAYRAAEIRSRGCCISMTTAHGHAALQQSTDGAGARRHGWADLLDHCG